MAGPAKALEDIWEELVGKAGPVVTDLDHQHLACAAIAPAVIGCLPYFAGHIHDTAVGGMPDGVVDHAAQRLPQPARIGDRRQLAGCPSVDGDATGARLRGETVRRRKHLPRHIDPGRSQERDSVVGAGQHEQVFGQPDEPVSVARRGRDRRRERVLRPPRARGQFELGLERGQRRPQFMARISNEPALPGQRLVQPVQQPVRGDGERRDLIPGPGHGKPGVAVVLGDLIQPPAHPVHRA